MMKLSFIFFQLVIITILFSACEKAGEEEVLLFYLGGQSNMDGYGYTKDLPDDLNTKFQNVYIFHGNPAIDNGPNGGQGIWKPLEPGHGVGFTSDGKSNTLSDRFGIELSFAKRLGELYPGQKIALIKYSVGGTSIDSMASYAGCWEPDFSGVNQYDNFLTTLKNAFDIEDIDGNDKKDKLIPMGIIWMQGESDAVIELAAQNYQYQLKRLMQLQRAAFLKNDLAVVVGKITDSGKNDTGKVWEYLEIVQEAQETFAKQDRNAAIVSSTETYNYSDPWHYDSKGFVDLGKQFADAVYQLNTNSN